MRGRQDRQTKEEWGENTGLDTQQRLTNETQVSSRKGRNAEWKWNTMQVLQNKTGNDEPKTQTMTQTVSHVKCC